MWKMCGVPFWSLILAAIFIFLRTVKASEPKVVCYYANWSVYRPGTAKFSPQNINPYLCTHLIYAFGGFTKENTLKPFDKYQDIEKGGYAKFTGLKTYNKRLKVLLAIGGWNEGSTRFSSMVAAKDRRRELVRNAIKFLRQNNFDGLDLDWEYPAFRDGGKPKDRENYAKLVKELREEFEKESAKTGKPRLLLTMAVPAGIEYIDKGYDIKKLNQYLDWMNILSYDFHSAFEPTTNHHAPLYPLEEPNEYSVDDQLNIDYVIKYYLEKGADREKLVLGIPTYGRSYTLFNPDATEMGAPADGPGEQGEATREKGYLAYYEICEGIKGKETKPKRAPKDIDDSDDDDDEDDESDDEEDENIPWTVVKVKPDAMGPYAFKGNQWVGYDDMDIVKKKAEYVAQNQLGGIMFWTLDNDDFRGSCHGKPYPLIETAKEALIANYGTLQNSVVQSKSRPSSASTTRRPTVQSTTASWSVDTPEPPTTPDPGSDFKCKEEGFYPHPRDCKKYFWCLDSGPSNLGIVAHQFTCPSGLFFNKAADSCDFARNVICKKPSSTTKKPSTTTRKATTSRTAASKPSTSSTSRPVTASRSRLTSKSSIYFRTTTTSTSTTTEAPFEDEIIDETPIDDPENTQTVEDPNSLKELIDLIRKVGGVEELERQLGLAASPHHEKKIQNVLQAKKENKLHKLNNFIKKELGVKPVGGVQNSGGFPQFAIDDEDIRPAVTPRYTTINRSRAPSAQISEPESEREIDLSVRPLPQYVNIRRQKPLNIAPVDIENENSDRDALYEPNITEGKETGNSLPQYVTINRPRPESAASSTTERYDNINGGKIVPEENMNPSVAIPNYVTLVRTTSSAPSTLSVQLSSILNSPSTTTAEPSSLSSLIPETEPPVTIPETTTTIKPSSSVRTRRPLPQRRGRPTTQSTSTTSTISPTQQTERRRTFPRRTRPQRLQTNTTESSVTISTTHQPLRQSTRNRTYSRKSAPNASSTDAKPSQQNGGQLANVESARKTLATTTRTPFVRRRFNIGGRENDTPTTTTTTPQPTQEPTDISPRQVDVSSRRPFRVAARRRPVTSSSTIGDVSMFLTSTEHSVEASSAQFETLSAVETDPPLIEDHKPVKKVIRLNQKPRARLLDDQNPLPSNTEKSRESKKYSSTFRLNELEGIKKKSEEVDDSTEALEKLTPDTAVALAAHHLKEAPLPSTPSYEYDYNDPPAKTTVYLPRSTIKQQTTTKNKNTSNQQRTTSNQLRSTKSPTPPVAFYETTYPTQKPVVSTFETILPNTGFSHLDTYSRINEFLDNAGRYSSVPIDDYAFTTSSYPGIRREPAYFTRDYLLESPATRGYDQEYQYLSTISNSVTSPRPTPTAVVSTPRVTKKISTTLSPSSVRPKKMPDRKVKVFEKIANPQTKKAVYKLVENYDYYDENNEKIFQSYSGRNMVQVHGKGDIQCLDQGNFPHPASCKKFISCAKMENGGLYGWEYTCPKGLSYDPVGGICNWSIGLGCREA